MSDDLRELFSQPTEITLPSGKTVRARPIDFEDFAALQEWIDRQQPSAIEAFEKQIINGRLVPDGVGGYKRDSYPEDMQKFLYDRALYWDSTRRVFLGSPEADSLLRSQSGIRQLARMALRKGTPDITDREVDEVLRMMDDQQRSKAAVTAEVPLSGRPKADDRSGGPGTAPPTASAGSNGGVSSASSWSGVSAAPDTRGPKSVG